VLAKLVWLKIKQAQARKKCASARILVVYRNSRNLFITASFGIFASRFKPQQPSAGHVDSKLKCRVFIASEMSGFGFVISHLFIQQ
jgi:hypothetical protein